MSLWISIILGTTLFFTGARQRNLAAAQEGTPEPAPTVEGDEEAQVQATEDPSATATAVPNVIIDYRSGSPAEEEEGEVLVGNWTLPLNLSQSGATGRPQMVRDSSDNYHVLWQDAVSGYVYTTGSGYLWSAPLTLELPFATRSYFPDLEPEEATPSFPPILAADGNGLVHAFWKDDSTEGDVVFYHSSVPAGSFTNFDSWTSRSAIENGVSKVSWAVDGAGRLHLVYIRTDESAGRPSGVYYRRLESDGQWSAPEQLYNSRYLRAVPEEEANVQIAARDANDLFVVWDDTGREQVFFTHSGSAGGSWDSVQEIDRRSTDDGAGSDGPGQIAVGAEGDTLLLTWRAGHEPGRQCTQYFQSSSDGGTSWSLPDALQTLSGCFSQAQFVNTDQGLFLAGTVEQEGSLNEPAEQTTYLLAWNGAGWSDPQEQDDLSRMVNPDTSQTIQLGCRQALGAGSRIDLLGCDNGLGQDIWLTSRETGDSAQWFPPPAVWNGPVEAGRIGEQPADLILVDDDQGKAHAFWFSAGESDIYHAAWNGTSWSATRPIVITPDGHVEAVAAASAGSSLYLTWRDSLRGLMFSKADLARPAEWAEPRALVEPDPGAAEPVIVADRSGVVTVAYTVPLNEQRGIYVTQSTDGGDSWAAPLPVFDGTAAGWEMVGGPSLARTSAGLLHVQWPRQTLPPDGQTLALHYSRSEDDGATWSSGEEVVEEPAAWSDLVASGERFVHRLWGEGNSDRLLLWHQVSADNGLNWSRKAQVTGLSEATAPAVAIDAAGRPHVLAIQAGRLWDWSWQEEQWLADEGLDVPFSGDGILGAAGSRGGRLLALYAGEMIGESSAAEEEEARLFAMDRELDIPPDLLAPLPTLTPTPAPTAIPLATATPQPTPTVFYPHEQQTGLLPPGPELPGGLDGNMILVGIVPAGLVVLVVVLAGVRLRKGRR